MRWPRPSRQGRCEQPTSLHIEDLAREAEGVRQVFATTSHSHSGNGARSLRDLAREVEQERPQAHTWRAGLAVGATEGPGGRTGTL